MSQRESVGRCQRCGREVHGRLGVFDSTVGGVAVVAIRETSRRDWICCDICNVMVCHACCQKPESGYCNDCLSRITAAETGG